MKIRMNIIFFGICFIAAIMGEAYCLQVLKGEPISTGGIGVVVLIIGYLLLDTIKSNIMLKMDSLKSYTNQILKEETKKREDQYNELLNIQKATYTATKKNATLLIQQMKDILLQLEARDINVKNSMHRITDLQKKSMEGQKNALNMEIHYNRENTKKIIQALHAEEDKVALDEKLSRIIELLETMPVNDYNVNTEINSNKILSDEIDTVKNESEAYQETEIVEEADNYGISEASQELKEDIISEPEEEQEVDITYESEDELKTDLIHKEEKEQETEIINEGGKEQEADIIHAAEKQQEAEILNATENDQELDIINAIANDQEVDTMPDVKKEPYLDHILEQEIDYEPDITEAFHISGFNSDSVINDETDIIKNASDSFPIAEESEAIELLSEEPKTEQQPEDTPIVVKPLYDDPNKSLSADEIAALFASFGS